MMGHSARILADSLSPDGVRLTTFELVFPRIILAEFNTHRMFSRNSASSRAIPVEKLIKAVTMDPYIPTHWGKNQKGMQAEVEVSEGEAAFARLAWLKARDAAVDQAAVLLDTGIHKQITNRLLEPFMWHTVIVTATEWSNFFHLRNNPMAHPDIQVIAAMMQELYEAQEPKALDYYEWHTPLITEEDLFPICEGDEDEVHEAWMSQVKVSVGRCARVSYLTHDGKRDIQADIALHDSLLKNGHLSPFEHVARPVSIKWQGDLASHDFHFAVGRVNQYHESVRNEECWYGNFRGWFQYRKFIPYESDILAPR